MRVQSVEQRTAVFYEQPGKREANFEEVFLAAQQNREQKETAAEEVCQLSFREMIDLEHKAIVALRQGDLVGHERYIKELSGHQGALERVEAAAEAQAAETNMNNGIFPEDAPQSIKSYVSGLSMRERMSLFIQVAAQEFSENAYKDESGRWRVRHRDELGFVNIFKQPDFTYTKLVEKMLAHVDFSRKYISQEKYEERLDVVMGLKEAAQGH